MKPLLFINSVVSKIIQSVVFTRISSKIILGKELVVFFIPPKHSSNGGIISIFNLAKESRRFNKTVLLATLPSFHTYIRNRKIQNKEFILNFRQIINIIPHLEKVTLHIPEYYAGQFYEKLSQKEISKLTSIPNLHINILNQNIQLMPSVKKLASLYTLTPHITQTVAHTRYCSQELSDQYHIPTHLFHVYADYSMYDTVPFEKKDKVIVLSPDKNKYKQEIIQIIKKDFPDYAIKTIKKMTFLKYIQTISHSLVTISFGEGFDGYFIEPPKVGSLSIAVYNDDFFPSPKWKKCPMVYKNWGECKKKLSSDLKKYFHNKNLYSTLVSQQKEELMKLSSYEQYLDNIKRFYEKKYDFFPRTAKKILKEK